MDGERHFLRLNTISCLRLFGSELGFVFHWKAHWFIVSELSLRSLAEILISWTTENKDALSANNLLSLLKSLDTLTDTRMDINPRKTLTIQSYSLRRKSSKMLRISPLAPYWRNLKSSPLCQTLSQTFVMSRKIPRTSSPLPNTFRISWLIERSWLMQEPLGLNLATDSCRDSVSDVIK